MFSVIVPLYNKRSYIRRCVDSVLNQTFNDFELIVVDDGSTDGSHEVLADIDDQRFRLIRQENKGEGAARNAGMDNAHSEWLAFLDGDDMWLPDHLAELHRIVTTYPDAGLVSTSCLEVSDSNNFSLDEREGDIQIRKIDYFREASRKIGVINSSSSAVRQNVYRDIGGFGGYKAGADLEFWARVALYYPVAISNRVTCLYFRNTNGVMEQLAKKQQPKVLLVTSLRDISPSVACLCDIAEREPARWQDPGICAYVNSRVYNAIRGALYHGDLVRARNLKRLMLPSSELRIKLLKLYCLLPDSILSIWLTTIRTVKSIK